MLGGQFTSRINRNLREERAITYGARTSFDFRRAAGAFSVRHQRPGRRDGDGGRRNPARVRAHPRAAATCSPASWRAAQASLTRGYVRNFETAGQLARAAAQLVTYGLPHDAFDSFVPSIEAIDDDIAHRRRPRAPAPGRRVDRRRRRRRPVPADARGDRAGDRADVAGVLDIRREREDSEGSEEYLVFKRQVFYLSSTSSTTFMSRIWGKRSYCFLSSLISKIFGHSFPVTNNRSFFSS